MSQRELSIESDSSRLNLWPLFMNAADGNRRFAEFAQGGSTYRRRTGHLRVVDRSLGASYDNERAGVCEPTRQDQERLGPLSHRGPATDQNVTRRKSALEAFASKALIYK